MRWPTEFWELFTEPYDLGGRKVVIGVSIGITLAPDDGRDADTLIRNADLALYKAKSEGRNRYRLFEASMEAQARERRELEADMRKALARDEFELHYQTIVDVESGRCCGAEALIRWRHPQRGLIPPDQFICLAEESGFIVPLGAWILRRACADAAKWAPHLTLAVNLSPMQFKQCDLPDILSSALRESGLAPERLELEITETVLIEKNEENLAVLRRLKKPRRSHRARRFRDRLFVDAISADISHRQDQDRQILHPKHAEPFRQHGHRVRDRRPGAKSRHRDDRGRGRDGGAARARAQRRLPVGARLSVQPSGAGSRARRSRVRVRRARRRE